MTLQNKKKGKIELLAPARNIECGIEAIKHGADAVYIGGPSLAHAPQQVILLKI